MYNQACSDTDDSCVCTKDVALGLQECEQCMFEIIVKENIQQPSPLVGSNFALTGELPSVILRRNQTSLHQIDESIHRCVPSFYCQHHSRRRINHTH